MSQQISSAQTDDVAGGRGDFLPTPALLPPVCILPFEPFEPGLPFEPSYPLDPVTPPLA
jgi:hypothetical protein